ncbi:MAG TPA: efflux RND transporter periplasmic adaptor subunit [Gemmata sp.]|nr:efflux RND transporter periplasmic adaptor subunit [Gemmata sp.]
MRASLFVLVAGLVFLAGTKAADPRPGGEQATARDSRDSEIASLKKEIEALRKRVEALEQKDKHIDQIHHKVVVTSALVRDVEIGQQYPCTIHARRHIEVRALVTGVVEEVAVKEGQEVKKGDVIFKMVPTLQKAKLDAEKAEVQIAHLEFEHTAKLFDQKVVGPQELAIYKAKLARAQAKAKLAETELNFTIVKAPFDGIVGRPQAQQGSTLKVDDTLTTLSDNSVVWVYFNVSEARYLEYMADRQQMKEWSPIKLVLANGKEFAQTGKLAAIEGQFDNKSGNIPFRVDFPNPKGLLRHGQTGSVLIRETLKNALVIPQGATFELRDKRYVYVVGKDGVVHPREVVVQSETDHLFVIAKGLDVSDRIVIEGVRQLRDGEKVEFMYRKPEAVIAEQKQHGEK